MKNKKKPDWVKIKNYYISNNISAEQLAKKFGVTYGAVRVRSKKEEWVRCRQEQFRKIDERVAEETAKKEIEKKVALNQKHIELYDNSIELVEKFIEIYKQALSNNSTKLKKGINPFNLEKIIACIERIQKGQRLALNIKDVEQINSKDAEPVIHIIEGLDLRKL